MSKSGDDRKPATFLQSIQRQANSLPFQTMELIYEEEVRGLIIYDAELLPSQATRLLRKSALTLTDTEEHHEISPDFSTDSCQVSVEERAQLFSIFGTGGDS